jgi:acetyl-CoA carboxylase biotin carboxyl carrier protein
MDLREIKLLLDAVAKSGTSELSLETPDYKVTIKRGGVVQAPPATQTSVSIAALQTPVPQAQTSLSSMIEEKMAVAQSNLVDITAPIVGTFYASPSPDAGNFVKIGDRVEAGKVLCIIEAMKLMNEIEAEVSGTIAEILVKNEEPVEYGQVLFRVNPA